MGVRGFGGGQKPITEMLFKISYPQKEGAKYFPGRVMSPPAPPPLGAVSYDPWETMHRISRYIDGSTLSGTLDQMLDDSIKIFLV